MTESTIQTQCQSQKYKTKKQQKIPKHLNILCIGESRSGKTVFLKRITKSHLKQARSQRLSFYRIFAKRFGHRLVYFHQLSDKAEVYLQAQYDGVIFFVDLIQNLRIRSKIISWMELYASCSGKDVFKIPILIVVTKTYGYRQELMQKWRQKLSKQLLKIVNKDQIMFWQSIERANKKLKAYCDILEKGQGEGIINCFRTELKLFGYEETAKYLISRLEEQVQFCKQKIKRLLFWYISNRQYSNMMAETSFMSNQSFYNNISYEQTLNSSRVTESDQITQQQNQNDQTNQIFSEDVYEKLNNQTKIKNQGQMQQEQQKQD